MIKIFKLVLIFCWILVLNSCEKSEFLNKKPNSGISTPTTLSDFESLLDNTSIFGYTGALGQMSSDDYELNYEDWLTLTPTQRNCYIWSKDIYMGDVKVQDWNTLYKQVFYANSVLDGLKSSNLTTSVQSEYLKGWALFNRAYAFYDLTRSFCPSYQSATSNIDLGIPLRLTSAIDYNVQRSTLQNSFEQILDDLINASKLLPAARPSNNLNRPSKIAAYALLARIYLDMKNYSSAGNFADQCLTLYSTLIDYNSVDQSSSTPFSKTNDELIYNSSTVLYDVASANYISHMSSELVSLYSANDLRLNTYTQLDPNGRHLFRIGYVGEGAFPFTGLATDEVYLIKAECLARNGQTKPAMDLLNQLLIKRYSNSSAFIPLSANSTVEAVNLILKERRKELVWRGLRWHDIKRLNTEGANISLVRTLNGTSYFLPSNDPRWVFPIPDDEIALSNLKQNSR